MKLTPWMLTVAAFGVIALLAVGFLAKKLFAAPVVEVKPPEPRVLPMAITAIEPGTVITRAHVGNGRAVPGQELAKDTFTSVDGVIRPNCERANRSCRATAGLNVLCSRRSSRPHGF